MPEAAENVLPELTASTRQVTRLLLRCGPLPRAELARRLSLTPAALSKLTRPMLEIGLFQQLESPGRARAGRPVVPLWVRPDWAAFIGIKLTGDTSYAVLTDLTGAVLHAVETPLPTHVLSDVLDTIVDQVNYLDRVRPAAAMAITLAGTVMPSTGYVTTSPFLGWSDVNLGSVLTKRLDMSVTVDNDLRGLTTAQHWFDSTLSSFALITFGAGIGCGLVLDDRPVHGSFGAAGLVEHLRIADDGPECRWGHRGCVSSYATTAAMLRAGAHTSLGPPADLAELAERARDGDRRSLDVLRNAGYALGSLIGTVCNLTGPGRVLLSGEAADLFQAIAGGLYDGIAAAKHPALPTIPLSVARLTFTDWARAAAVVAIKCHLRLNDDATGRERISA